jgi:hypothetical protein
LAVFFLSPRNPPFARADDGGNGGFLDGDTLAEQLIARSGNFVFAAGG